MKKYKIILSMFIALFFGGSSFSQKKKSTTDAEDKWSGTITYTQTTKNKGSDQQSEIKTEWNYFNQSQANANIANNQVMASRSETTTDLVKTTSPFGKGLDQVEVRTKKISCERRDSIAEREISIEINNKDSIYSISLFAPACSGYMHSTIENNILQMGGQPATNDTKDIEYDVLNVNIFKQRLGKNPKILTGQTQERITPPGGGEIVTTITWNLRIACPPWKNPLTETNINTLDSKVKAASARFIKRVNDELCIRLKVASGHRTKDEQDAIYAIGRDKNGKKIGKTFTNARGGESNHNFGKAIDVYYATDTGIDLDRVLAPEIVEIARQEGFSWGGNWSDPDYPHFEMKP